MRTDFAWCNSVKYLYIAGLEHSGTTLLNQLLGAAPAVPVGEVFQLFSSEFMAGYRRRWGGFDDAFLCACGDSWRHCPFWGSIPAAIDLENQLSRRERYQLMLERARSMYGDDAIIVDSSKSTQGLEFVRENQAWLGLGGRDLLVVAAFRDVRGFVASQLARAPTRGRSPRRVLALMRLWLHENRRLLERLESGAIPYTPSLYEAVCRDEGAGVAERIHAEGFPRLDPSLDHDDGHIALGNKNFLHRNRHRIRYDDRWFTEDGINLVYQLYAPVRKFNRRLYTLAAG